MTFRWYLSDFFGPRTGPGMGVGMAVHNLTRQNDRWLLTAAPALFEQVVTLSFASADPNRARKYVMVNLRGLRSERDWASFHPDVERSSLHGRIRLGRVFLDHRLLVQPHVTISHNIIEDIFRRGIQTRGDFLSRQGSHFDNLHPALPDPNSQQTGVSGISLSFVRPLQALRPPHHTLDHLW